MSAQSAVASMKTVKRAAIAARLRSSNAWPRGLPGTRRVGLLACPTLVSGSTTGAVRPDDHPTVRRYDALPDEGTVGAIGIVFVTAPTIVAIPRPDAEAERADLHASPSGVRTHIDLSGGRNRCNEQGAGCYGQ